MPSEYSTVVILDIRNFHTYVLGILNRNNPSPEYPLYTASSNSSLASVICTYAVLTAARNIYKRLRGERVLTDAVSNFHEFFGSDTVLIRKVVGRAAEYAIYAMEALPEDAINVEVTSSRSRSLADFPLIFKYQLEFNHVKRTAY